MDALLTKADDTATRLRRLESAPPPPPPPLPRRTAAQFPPPPPPAWVNPFDLNLAPEAATRPSTSTAERPNGHGFDASTRVAGGGILGSAPPRPVTGTSNNPPPHTLDFMVDRESRPARSSCTPKLEFPKFDGQNSRLWKDRCELYFEVYTH